MRGKDLLAGLAIGCIAIAPAPVFLGCGEGDANVGPSVTLSVSREFSRVTMIAENQAPLDGSQSVLQLLREHARVKPTSDGTWVKAIDGHAFSDGRNETTWAL